MHITFANVSPAGFEPDMLASTIESLTIEPSLGKCPPRYTKSTSRGVKPHIWRLSFDDHNFLTF